MLSSKQKTEVENLMAAMDELTAVYQASLKAGEPESQLESLRSRLSELQEALSCQLKNDESGVRRHVSKACSEGEKPETG